MKTIQAIELYNILKDLFITGLSPQGQHILLKNLRQLRPLINNYNEAIEEAQEYLKPFGFDEAEAKANVHNQAVQSGKEESFLSNEELWEVTCLYDEYNKALNSYINELNEEEADIFPSTINQEDFDKLIAINDKHVTAGNLAILEEILYQS